MRILQVAPIDVEDFPSFLFEGKIALALGQAEKGDVVIVAGKGHETTQEIAGVKHPFDDREVVREFRRS